MAATVAGILLVGDHASRPAAASVPVGSLYSCTDHDLVYQTDGATWATWATLGTTVTFGTPALVLGTAAAAGSTDEVIRKDATIVAFDATVPVTQNYSDAAATGSAAVAARRDHVHGMPASGAVSFANTITLGGTAANGAASTALRSDATIDAFDATNPAATNFGDAAAVGTADFAARRDHVHPRIGDTFTVNFIIDGGGSAITTGIKGDIFFDYACTINQVTVLADQTGSIVVDIWEDTYANYPPVDADSITASAPPTLSSASKSQDSTLTGWSTTAIVNGSVLRFNVDSITTCTRVLIALKITRTS